MLRRIGVYTCLAVLCGASVSLGADDILIQPNEAASADVFVYQFLPTSNFNTGGFGTVLGIAETTSGHDVRTVIQFDLSSVTWPAQAVGKATLGLYVIDGAAILGGALANPSPSAVAYSEVYRLNGSWSEGTVTWNTQPATTGTAMDNVGIDGIDQWLELEVTDAAREWLAGTLTNNGLRVIQTNHVLDDGVEVGVFFDSSANPNKPYLLLQPYPFDYEPDGDVDVADFAHFQTCFSGPGATAPSGCEFADFNGDNDVDVSDFAQFALCFNGPGQVPACSVP